MAITVSTSGQSSLGVLVVVASFGVAGGELAGVDINRVALPLGVVLFASVVFLRLWSGGAGWNRPSPNDPRVQSGRT